MHTAPCALVADRPPGVLREPLADEAAYDATELHEDAFPTLTALRERWMTEQREMWAYIDTVTEEMLNGKIRYVIPGAVREHVVWHLLLDAINHASRGATSTSPCFRMSALKARPWAQP